MTALAAAAFAPSAHAQVPRAGDTAPEAYVVCVDPGHGGAVDTSDPSLQYDPGAIGIGGLEEKTATLDTGLRLRDLLEKDGVTAAMTRTTDAFVGIAHREATCEDAHANLFISVHLNYFTDPAVGGSLVLYPSESAHAFATTMAQTLGKDLAPAGVPNNGTQLRDNWWGHATMPTITVEGAYLTSRHDAAWIATAKGRQQLAQAIRDGIVAYDPAILAHRTALSAWTAAHPAAAPATATPDVATTAAPSANSGVNWLLVVMLGAGVVAAMRQPAASRSLLTCVGRIAAVIIRHGVQLAGRALLHRHQRRRRRRVRQRTSLPGGQPRQRSHSVYDEIWF